MATSQKAQQPQLLIQPITAYRNEDGDVTGVFVVVKSNFATKDKQLQLLDGCPMWVNQGSILPFAEELFALEYDGETGRFHGTKHFTLPANNWQVQVARYLNPETGEIEPRTKNRRNPVTGELQPDTFMDGTVKVFVQIVPVVTSAPDWA